MKKSILFFVSAAALFLSGCEDGLRPGNDNGIKFSASKLITKTVYDENDDLQINWVSGDQVKIYCLEAEDATEATYNVNPKETKNKGNLSLASGKPLQWGGDTGVHNFFSVYPASSSISVENGIALCKVNTNQVCTVRNSDADDMIADPDMANAYMVANLSTEPVDKVELHYRPIMTTLKITVRAKTEANQELAAVTGVSIISKTKCYSDNFSYDIVNNSIIEGSTTKTVTTFVGVQNGESAFVDLEQGQTLTLTAFIPPVDINAENPVQVRLHAQHSDNLVVTLGKVESTCVKAASKRSVTLPHIPSKEVSGNNWITPLDDNIYVSQLSIPGTHDAATGDGTDFSIGKTQELTLDQQFEMGVRAFDLRPAVNANKEMILCHGAVATKFKWDQVMERFKMYLTKNPGEFIIVTLRHEEEYLGTSISHWTNENANEKWQPLMREKLQAMKDSGLTIDFRPDLTVGDMRGKILFLCRDWTPYDDAKVVVAGGYTGWGHSKDGAEVSIYGPSASGIMNIQDCYAPAESGEWNFWNNTGNVKLVNNFPTVKWNAIETLLNKSMTFHTNPDLINRWSINHTSGYVGSIVGGIAYSTSTTDGYRENAANNNIKLYNKINSSSWQGSTGIILSDFVGARYSGDYTVYGDLLPQAIIDNNYKYHMKRKTN